jgi:ketosteroid isomerase-like protein
MSLEVIKQVYEHVATGDMEAILGHCAEEVEWVVNAPAHLERCRAFEGVEGVRSFLETMDRGWKYRFAAPREFIDAGEKIVVLGEAEGKERETDVPFKSRWAHVFTVKDDRIVSFREFICYWGGDETPPRMSWH